MIDTRGKRTTRIIFRIVGWMLIALLIAIGIAILALPFIIFFYFYDELLEKSIMMWGITIFIWSAEAITLLYLIKTGFLALYDWANNTEEVKSA